MKYLSKTFTITSSSKEALDNYRKNWEQVFGKGGEGPTSSAEQK